MKSVNCSKPGYTSITCSKISTKLNDSSILITIISCDYLNWSLANEYVGDVTIPTQVIEYNQNFHQAHQPIILQYSNQIKLFWYSHDNLMICVFIIVGKRAKIRREVSCIVPLENNHTLQQQWKRGIVINWPK
jgi:hypothetical protein